MGEDIMIPEVGHYALVLALVVALVQGTLPLAGAARGDPGLMELARTSAVAQAVLVVLSFLALTWAYVVSDFSLLNVVANSHSTKPLLYKISGVWGNHEGSMLLWVLILSLFGASVAIFGGNLPASLRARALAVQGLVGVGFHAFILFTSESLRAARSRAVRRQRSQSDPPGPRVGLPSAAALPRLCWALRDVQLRRRRTDRGRVDAAWARWVRPWTLAAWCFLTLGIALGSWWAYYGGLGRLLVLDPVENASLMPWLLARRCCTPRSSPRSATR